MIPTFGSLIIDQVVAALDREEARPRFREILNYLYDSDATADQQKTTLPIIMRILNKYDVTVASDTFTDLIVGFTDQLFADVMGSYAKQGSSDPEVDAMANVMFYFERLHAGILSPISDEPTRTRLAYH